MTRESPTDSGSGICALRRAYETALRNTPDDFRALRINGVYEWRQRLREKRFTWHTINQEADEGGVFGKAGEVFGGDLAGVFAELLGDVFCVFPRRRNEGGVLPSNREDGRESELRSRS